MKITSSMLLLVLSLLACQSKITPKNKTAAPASFCAPKGVAVDALAETDKAAPKFEGLGNLDFPITTKSEEAQFYFNQGWQLANGFNHAEAARSFKYATKLDPECAMCWWGLAYVLGPNYNAGMEPGVVKIAFESMQNAQNYLDQITPKERILIEVMSTRYAPEPIEDRSTYDQAYSKALRKAYAQFPEDDNIGALFAESLMDLHPWDLWEKNGRIKPWTPEILETIEAILKRNPNHSMAIHLYIHATEASKEPGKAFPYAQRLPDLSPGAGHLVHMPSHTYIRTGDYHLGTLVNSKAVKLDSNYVSTCHAAGLYPLALYPHNFHFLTACAALEGNSELAINAMYRMREKLDTITMREPGWETIQHFWSIPYFVLVKFNKWEDILALPRPAADLIYPKAIWHYARGMAFAAKEDIAKAEEELKNVRLIETNERIQDIKVFDINNMTTLIKIAGDVLGGELAARQQDYPKAVELFQSAIALEDGLLYNEPPDWFFSVRHHLGTWLIRMEDYTAAEALYRDDLEIYPRTGWAYHGLYQSLTKQGKEKEAAEVRVKFEEAWKFADIKLFASTML